MYVSVCENVCVSLCECVWVCVQVCVRVYTHRLRHTYGSHRTTHFSPSCVSFRDLVLLLSSLILTTTRHTQASKLSK